MKLSSAITLFSLVFLLSCTKEVIENDIQGLWIGTYTVDGAPGQGSLFYSMAIYPDGSVVTKSKSSDGKDYFSKGTWTLNTGNAFVATITTFSPVIPAPITQRITATFAANGTLTNGAWEDTTNQYGLQKGKFSTFQKAD